MISRLTIAEPPLMKHLPQHPGLRVHLCVKVIEQDDEYIMYMTFEMKKKED